MLESLKCRVSKVKLALLARTLVWLLALTVLLLLQACGSAIDELNFTRKQPAVTNIIGTWIPSQQTLNDMRKIGGYVISTHELTMSSNGQFWMTNMPDWWTNGWGQSHKSFESGGGNWKLEKDTDGLSNWEISLWFTNSAGNFERVDHGVLHPMRQKPPYLIHIFRGDPDSGDAMYFERKEDHAPGQTR